jgi:hypothetical protein
MTHDIKALRSKDAQSAKLRKLGAQGSLSMARKGENAERKYATGGTVGPSISGGSAQPRGRTAGKGKGKKKKGDNHISITLLNAPAGGKGAPEGPMPMPGGPGGLPPGGPPMPPGPPGGGPGGPPMPMRASGGRIPPKEEAGKGSDLSKDKQLAKPFKKGGKC